MVDLRPRTILRVVFLVLAVAVTLEVLWIARHVLAWVVIALFLALALNPLVGSIQRRGRMARAPAIIVAYLLVLIVIVGVAATFLPKLIDEVNGFVAGDAQLRPRPDARARPARLPRAQVPRRREGARAGRDTVARRRLLGLSGAALSVTKSVITIILATVTIIFLTFFMLLEGRGWVERVTSSSPSDRSHAGDASGDDIYKTVGGYVTGNILISLIAGASTTVVLLIMGVPYAVALGLLVAFLDLVPLAGATIAGIIVVDVAFLHSVPPASSRLVFVIVYQQLENHFLQPVIYGRTVQLSPLVVLISVLIGAELAGVLGALAAIPVAGTLQVIVRDQLATRRGTAAEARQPP